MAELTRVHPLEHFGAELAERSNPAVTITPEPFVAMVDVRLPAAAADAALLGIALPTTPNTWVATSLGRIIWLGPGEWLLTSTVHDPDDFADLVRVSVQPLGGAVVDVSAQRIGLRLNGSRVRELLAKGCSIDLHPRSFTRGTAVQSTIAQAGVILLALSDADSDDRGDFLVLVRSSFAGYLADWLLDAAQEFSAAEATDRATDPISNQE